MLKEMSLLQEKFEEAQTVVPEQKQPKCPYIMNDMDTIRQLDLQFSTETCKEAPSLTPQLTGSRNRLNDHTK